MSEHPPIHHVQRQAVEALTAALGLDQRAARLEVQILLCHVLDQPRSWLISHDRDILSAEQAAAFQELLKRRLAGEPIAYILGEREFFSLKLKITPAVLIPRPETELLVELASHHLPDGACRVLDLGTGSGAIAIAVAHAHPTADVVAIDQSAEALEIAAENARNLAIRNLSFAQSRWFSALADQKFDLILSNPPYIAAADPHLAQGDLRFEPIAALASGRDGLDDIRAIIEHAPGHLNPGGRLLFEHGYDQAEACRRLLALAGFTEIASHRDLAGMERVTGGKAGPI